MLNDGVSYELTSNPTLHCPLYHDRVLRLRWSLIETRGKTRQINSHFIQRSGYYEKNQDLRANSPNALVEDVAWKLRIWSL